jgi:hypothetical protein
VAEDKMMSDEEFKKLMARLSDKFGGFTEGLALPSMTKILRERFKMEVKSHRREEAITQLNTLMGTDRALFPEHNNKKYMGLSRR